MRGGLVMSDEKKEKEKNETPVEIENRRARRKGLCER